MMTAEQKLEIVKKVRSLIAEKHVNPLISTTTTLAGRKLWMQKHQASAQVQTRNLNAA